MTTLRIVVTQKACTRWFVHSDITSYVGELKIWITQVEWVTNTPYFHVTHTICWDENINYSTSYVQLFSVTSFYQLLRRQLWRPSTVVMFLLLLLFIDISDSQWATEDRRNAITENSLHNWGQNVWYEVLRNDHDSTTWSNHFCNIGGRENLNCISSCLWATWTFWIYF